MRIRTIGIGILFLLSTVALVTAQAGRDLFRDCRIKDQVDLDTEGAIKICLRVISDFGTDRALLADARLYLGQLYASKDPAKAKEQYDLVAAMPDQPAKRDEARTRLSALSIDPYKPIVIPTPFTDDPFSFAISPDGQSVVYQSTVNGKSQLWLWRDGKEAPIQGTENARQFAMPFWSPDGKNIGFFAEQKLKTIPVGGGQARELATVPNPRGGTWSSAGVIVFAAANSPIYRIPAGGGSQTVAVPRGNVGGDAFPRFLEDGRQFHYEKFTGPNYLSGHLATLDTEVSTPFRSGPGAAQVLRDHLYFVGGQLLSSNFGILTYQPLNAQKMELAGGAVTLREQVALNPRYPGLAALSASPRGAIALRGESMVLRQLLWMDRAGEQKGNLGIADKQSPCCMRFTDDGTKIAYHRMINHGLGSVWVMDVATGTAFQFRNGAEAVAFSPKNDEIIWSGIPDNTTSGPNVMHRQPINILKSAKSQIGASQEARNITDVSGNGFVLYTRRAPASGSDILGMSDTGGEPIFVATGPAEERNGRFSPDSRWVVYQSDEGGADEIYVQPFPSSSDAKKKVSLSGGTNPQWSRDGKELYYLAADNRIMVVDVTLGAELERGTPRPLFAKPLRHGSTFEFTPDGQRILVNTPIEDPQPIMLFPNGPRRP